MKPSSLVSVLSVLASTFSLLNLNAQQSTIDYDLSDYQLPELKRHELEFNYDLSGSSHSTGIEYENVDSVKSNQKSFMTEFSPHYSYYLNNEKYQITHNLSTELPRLDFYSGKDNLNYHKSLNLQPQMSYSGELREYLKRKFFLEQDILVGLSTSNQSSFYEYLTDSSTVYHDRTSEYTIYTIDFSVPILAGWGRIERVEDARLAVYILDDLNKAGQLAREVSEEDIEYLARRISEVRNERFFDSRLKKIWELQQIDSLLISMRLIDTGNITYYALLNDNWDYSYGPVRQSGFRISAGASPEFSYSDLESSQEDNYYEPDTSMTRKTQNINRNIIGSLLFRVNYYKPINLYWQLSVSNELKALKLYNKKFRHYDNLDTTEQFNSIILNDQIDASLNYYPNSRTTMSLYTVESVDYTKIFPETGEETNKLYLSSRFGINIDYYISPRIRLDVSSFLDYTLDKESNSTEYSSTNLDYYIGASLVYKLL